MELYDFYKNILDIKDDNIIKELISVSKIIFVDKGFVVAEEDKIQKNLYFLVYGIFRGFFCDEEGNEFTDSFGFECGQPLMSSLSFGEKSLVNIIAVTDAKIIEIEISDIVDKLNKHQELLVLYNKLLLKSLEMHWKQKEVRYIMNAFDRYKWFLKTYPNLDEHIKDKDIASFLGMSPVTLCRVKKQK